VNPPWVLDHTAIQALFAAHPDLLEMLAVADARPQPWPWYPIHVLARASAIA
jgi:hypothetical protein